MKIEINQEGSIVVLALIGDFDASAVQTVHEQIQTYVDDSAAVLIVDLSQVSFMDSSAIGVLVRLFRAKQEPKNAFHLAGATGQPADLLELLQISRFIPHHADLNQAMAAAKSTADA